MLSISQAQLTAIADEARDQLCLTLLLHWREHFRASVDASGEAGCDQLLADVVALAEGDQSLDLADLVMLADLQLVALANERLVEQRMAQPMAAKPAAH